MPMLSPQAYLNLKASVKRRSYRVYRKRHKPVTFRTYASARAYCIRHQLDYKSSWVLTRVNHCA
jgi:hypothetical protein